AGHWRYTRPESHRVGIPQHRYHGTTVLHPNSLWCTEIGRGTLVGVQSIEHLGMMRMTEQHWGNFLVQGFPMDKEVEVTFPVEARSTRASMVLVASRIAGLMAALGPLDEHDPNADPLAAEDVTEVTRLLDHLHRVRVALEGEEE